MDLGTLVLEYGFEVVLIALLSILLVGVMKVAFKSKLERVDKANRKAIYEIASMLAVVLLTVGWILISGGAASNEYILKIMSAYGAMKVMYPLYENFRVRDLVQLIGKLLKEHKGEEE